MISQRLEYLMNKAIVFANEQKLEYLTIESLLLFLIEDAQVEAVFRKLNVDSDALSKKLKEFVTDSKNLSRLTDEKIEDLSKSQFVDERMRAIASENGIKYQPEFSVGLNRSFQRAAIHMQSSGKSKIEAIHFIVSLLEEKESFGVNQLNSFGVDRLALLSQIAHADDASLNSDEEPGYEKLVGAQPAKKDNGNHPSLDEYATELTSQMKIECDSAQFIGRQEELEKVYTILARKKKNNPLIVGGPGVGKTALVEYLAFQIFNKKVPTFLEDAKVFSLDIAAMMAGAKFRGDFEGRCKKIINELLSLKRTGTFAILFIDEIHLISATGNQQSGNLDAATLFRPYLGTGDLHLIGTTTHEEYRRFIEKDTALSRRFQLVDLEAPNLQECEQILKKVRPIYENHHSIKFPNVLLPKIVELSERFIFDRLLPDKAIDVMDELGAFVRLKKNKKNANLKDLNSLMSKYGQTITTDLELSETDRLSNLKDNLNLTIYGQNLAIDQVVDKILISKAGLSKKEKPLASFLFAGPTGVGKTEMAKQLTEFLGINFVRFDMSEYMEKHSVAKLIGAPPGYVGFDQGGVLTDAVKSAPHSLVLLDEIEKAHIDVYNVLLQVMDHGMLTDSHGRKTSFRNVILVMTSNAGAREVSAGSISLSNSENTTDSTARRDKAIKKFFSPEFRNRLDGIIHFNSLNNEMLLLVVDKFLIQLQKMLVERKIELIVSEKARQSIMLIGVKEKMGARPIERAIDENIKFKLTNEILFGSLKDGGKVFVDFVDSNFSFKFSPIL